MKKKYWIGSLLSAFVVVGAIMMVQPSLALFTSQDSAINNFEIGDVKISVKEEFNENNCVIEDGKTDCKKKVQIQNTEFSTDALVRVALVPYWIDENENAWPGDVTFETLKLEDKTDGEDKTDEKTIKLYLANDWETHWQTGTDGYYYYKAVLPKNTPTEVLLEHVEITLDSEVQERYKGKTLVIDVKAEAIQANVEAIKAIWPQLWITDVEEGEVPYFNEIGQMLERLINPTTTTIEE